MANTNLSDNTKDNLSGLRNKFSNFSFGKNPFWMMLDFKRKTSCPVWSKKNWLKPAERSLRFIAKSIA